MGRNQTVKYKVIATDDMHKGPHTWTQGLDYELEEDGELLRLASNEGQTLLRRDEREALIELFDGIPQHPELLKEGDGA